MAEPASDRPMTDSKTNSNTDSNTPQVKGAKNGSPTPPLVTLRCRESLWRDTLGWHPTPAQWSQYQALYAAIVTGNQQLNLTRLTTPGDFWEKHLWDSLCGLWPWLTATPPAWAEPVSQVIDIGTGAGFPGLPAAIALPPWQVTLLDSTQKKVRFLQELAPALGLTTVRAIADRAETLAHQPMHREQYDLALLRAVGPATPCAEYGLPLVRVGGLVVLYRGQWTPEEEVALEQAATLLGGGIVAIQPWQTPLTQGDRHCVYLRKLRPTPDGFPRLPGIPAKSPLGVAGSKHGGQITGNNHRE